MKFKKVITGTASECLTLQNIPRIDPHMRLIDCEVLARYGDYYVIRATYEKRVFAALAETIALQIKLRKAIRKARKEEENAWKTK